MKKEHENNGLLDADVSTPSQIDAYAAGYIDKDNELIVGLQTDAPLKRAIMPWGGHRMVEASCKAYGLKEDEKVKEIFTKYRKTHNEGVFQAYDDYHVGGWNYYSVPGRKSCCGSFSNKNGNSNGYSRWLERKVSAFYS